MPDYTERMTTYDRPFGRHFEDFAVGDVYRHWPGKTITEYDDHLFCMITMNHHPLHTNAWFAESETVHGRNVVVGNLVYSLALGMSVPDVSGSAIANLEVESLVHRHPTFHGDTIYAETKVVDKVASRSRDDRGVVTVDRFSTPEQFRDYFKARYGPTVAAYRAIGEDPERVAALDLALAELARRHDRGRDATVMDWEYLLAVARKRL